MDGVTILNMFETTILSSSGNGFSSSAFFGTLAITVLTSLFCGLFIGLNEEAPILGSVLGILVGLILGLMLGAIVGSGMAVTETVATYYEVTIDDTVSMRDFLEKYNIIEQRGLIYVVEEK